MRLPGSCMAQTQTEGGKRVPALDFFRKTSRDLNLKK